MSCTYNVVGERGGVEGAGDGFRYPLEQSGPAIK